MRCDMKIWRSAIVFTMKGTGKKVPLPACPFRKLINDFEEIGGGSSSERTHR